MPVLVQKTNLTSENQIKDLYNVDLQFFFFFKFWSKDHKNLDWLREESKDGLEGEKRKERKVWLEVWWSLAWAVAV